MANTNNLSNGALPARGCFVITPGSPFPVSADGVQHCARAVNVATDGTMSVTFIDGSTGTITVKSGFNPISITDCSAVSGTGTVYGLI